MTSPMALPEKGCTGVMSLRLTEANEGLQSHWRFPQEGGCISFPLKSQASQETLKQLFLRALKPSA